ncbi:MAG TPA: cyclic nucleotide-binding domain-containing protein [Elusimicrobiales bacterium]|nr:cyclic nucleotide-binding domain-containing protein [Elusimicrobiales bacterium]
MKKFKFLKKIFTNIKFQEKKNFLVQLPIFKELSLKDIARLMRGLKEKTFLKDEILFKQGDAARALFIVSKGKVDLKKTNPDNTSEIIGHANAGEFFGEMALLEDMPRTVTAVATEKTHVFMLFKSTLDNMVFDRSKAGVSIIHYLAKTLSARVRTLTEDKK